MLRNVKTRKYILFVVLIAVLMVVPFVAFADAPVSVEVSGPRLIAKVEGGVAVTTYQWQISDTAEGVYADISGATEKYYDISAADEGKYIKVFANGTESLPVGPIGKLIVMDIGKGAISFDATYSGKDSDGNAVSGTHIPSNIYMIVHKENGTKTTNNIAFGGNLPDKPFDVTLAGVNMGSTPQNHNQAPGSGGINTPSAGEIRIPAQKTAIKKVTLRLLGENIVRYISYYNGSDTNVPQNVSSYLKITDINGDGETEGGSLYVPVKLAPEEIEAFVNSKTNYNHWNAGIGGTDGNSLVQNLYIAGGKIQVVTTLGDNCTAIGAGGNGYCQMEISGGEVIAHCNGTGAAIGGGIGWNAAGGQSDVLISGGKVYAKNHAMIQSGSDLVGGVAIGSGSSFYKAGSEGKVTITGGEVEAYGTFGNGIGGGNSSTSTGGKANITISGGVVTATSIGGGNSKAGVGGSADVTVSAGADVTLLKGIGGGLSESGDGGAATIKVTDGTMNCGGVIGGGNGGGNGTGGKAIIRVTGGTLTAKSIGGGTGGTGGHGGAAEIYISGGKIETGFIGGGSTLNTTNGKLGYAKAVLSGGDISGQFIMAAGGTEACTFTMTGGKLHGIDTSDSSKFTYAQNNGAAVYMDDPDGIVEISDGTITDCSAENGGAVYMTAGTFTLSGGGAITGCKATASGGAIYLGGGTVYINGGSVDHNTAVDGGGIYLGGGTLNVTDGDIKENTATNNGGGAYVNAASEEDGVFVSGGEITGNVAAANGGGVAVNNGAYKMTGGAVDGNTATTGRGGGIYVASSGVDVLVEIRSGSVSGNKAGTSGGAVAVVGQDGGQETITVTVGVNERHYDEDGNEIPCEHDYDVGDPVVAACPVLRDNYATKTGGGIYITGGEKTMLNTYCLEESGSSAADGKALSNFMMVEGGTVVISTADQSYNGDDHGKITINNTIHVYAGEMDLYGSMSDPMIIGAITVDITVERGSYEDHRYADSKYYKLQYFENFLAPGAEKPTGRYTVFQIKHGDSHEILPALYKHDGYVIDGWWTSELGDVAGSIEYLINKSYTFVDEPAEKPGNLTLYAKWLPVGYYVYFDVGTTDPHRGEMETVRYNYDTENTLPANAFFRPGWLFAGWDYDGTGDAPLLKDMATVKNLTTERGITLVAIWTLCTHQEEQFTYSVTGDSLVRNCYCEKCTQIATLIAGDTVFVDGNTIPYEAEIKVVTNATNGAQPGNWNPEPTYTGAKYNGNAFEPEEFLIGAGRYTVSITAGGKTATVNFEIKKAEQSPPAEPKFESFETNQTVEKGKIKIIDPQDTTGGKLRYKIIWHDDAGTPHEKIADLHTATTAGFVLDTNYTNYYVYVQYEADDNHNESIWVRARSVLFYEGNVYIFIDCEDGINYETKADETHRGLIILVSANSGYYLYDIKVADNHQDTHIGDPTTEDGKLSYYISGIPKSDETPIRIDLTISGVKKAVVISGALTEGEAFGTVKGNTAVITRDSAYTAYFEVKNYDVYTNPKLHFSTALPENTTVILVDKTTGIPVYWSTTLENASTEIPLSTLVRMGTVDDTFTLPQNTTELVLKYQVIVDFSDSAGCSGETLTTKFTAERSADAEAKGAPVFPEHSLETKLKDAAVSSLNVSDSTNTMQKNLQIEFLRVPTGTVASKWNGRRVALVLTPTVSLPGDARIEVVDQTGMKTQYYRNADGKYIVSLTDVQRDTLRLTLLSQLFPDEKTEYTFRAELICASSLAGESPLNGVNLIEVQEITFVKETKLPDPSLKIQGDKRVYDVGDTVKVTVNYENLPEHTALVLRLLSKDASPNSSGNTYIDSGWKQQKDTVLGENKVPLGQNLTGSCCIVLELRDIMGNVIVSVPYYFVISS